MSDEREQQLDEADVLPGAGSVASWDESETDVEHETNAGADTDSNELHAPGEKCSLCGQLIEADDVVRRTASGLVEHEHCPAADS